MPGANGAGVVGAGVTIITSGTISGSSGGGGEGGGGIQANAIAFTGGANTLTLQSGFAFNGNIAVQAPAASPSTRRPASPWAPASPAPAR